MKDTRLVGTRQMIEQSDGPMPELSGANVDDREPVTPRVMGLAAIRHALAKALPESTEAHERPLEVGRRAHR